MSCDGSLRWAPQAGAKEKDKYEKLPLHFAVEKKAPVEVVEALLAAYKASAPLPSVAHKSK